MITLALVVALLAITVVCVAIGERVHLPYPILMLIASSAMASIPGLPHLVIDSHLILPLLLPPLLFATAQQTSWTVFRYRWRTLLFLAVGMTAVTAALVAGAVWMMVPGIALPLAIPGFVVVLIWQFTNAWNDFLFAVFFSSPANGPVTLALNNLANGALLANYGVSMAGALLASVPTLLVYILLSKYFLAGLMQGSVKG